MEKEEMGGPLGEEIPRTRKGSAKEKKTWNTGKGPTGNESRESGSAEGKP